MVTGRIDVLHILLIILCCERLRSEWTKAMGRLYILTKANTCGVIVSVGNKASLGDDSYQKSNDDLIDLRT